MFSRFVLLMLAGFLLVPGAPAADKIVPAPPAPDKTVPGMPAADKARTDLLGDPLPAGATARLGTLRFKHSPANNLPIADAMFTLDGKKIATVGLGDGSVRLWEADTGKEIKAPWSTNNNNYANPGYMASIAAPVASSADGKYLAVAPVVFGRQFNNGKSNGTRESVILYDLVANTRLKALTSAPQIVRALRFVDEGKTIVAAGDGTVRWWDVATGKEKRSWSPFTAEQPKSDPNGNKTKTFSSCEISPDGKFIAFQVDWRNDNNNGGGILMNNRSGAVPREVMGYQLDTGKKYWQSSGKGAQHEQSRFAFSADGKRLAIACGQDKIELRDAVTGKLARDPLDSQLGANGRLGGLTLSSDGATIAWASQDSNIQIASTTANSPPRRFTARLAQKGPNSTICVRFSPDNSKLAVGVDADLQLYDVATLAEVNPWEGHRGWIDRLAFTPDGKRLLTGSAGRGRAAADYYGPNGEIYYLINERGREINPSPELAAWDVATWKRSQLTSDLAPPWPNYGNTSLQQTTYAGKTGADRFALFSMKTGQLVARLRTPDGPNSPGNGYFSPAGKHYVLYTRDAKGQPGERLYAVPSGKLVCQLPPTALNPNRGGILLGSPADLSNNIAFSREEKLVAQFGRGDGLIHVYETSSGKLRHTLGTKVEFDENNGYMFFHYDAAFSHDGKYLAGWTTIDKAIHVWDMASGAEVSRIEINGNYPTYPGAGGLQGRLQLAWSPDGRLLAVAEKDITIWELAALSVRRKLPGHADGTVRTLAFAPDGHVLASASSDTTVLIWDMTTTDRTTLVAGALEGAAMEKRWQALAARQCQRGF